MIKINKNNCKCNQVSINDLIPAYFEMSIIDCKSTKLMNHWSLRRKGINQFVIIDSNINNKSLKSSIVNWLRNHWFVLYPLYSAGKVVFYGKMKCNNYSRCRHNSARKRKGTSIHFSLMSPSSDIWESWGVLFSKPFRDPSIYPRTVQCFSQGIFLAIWYRPNVTLRLSHYHDIAAIVLTPCLFYIINPVFHDSQND